LPPRQEPPSFDDHLKRVVDETFKAASYQAAALSWRFVPDLGERWEESPVQLGFQYMRQGAHMAFLVTLAALLEARGNSELVNLPSLLRLLDDQQVRRAISDRRRLDARAVYLGATRLQERYRARIVPLAPRIEEVRNNVVAHHGRNTDWPDSTIGVLKLAMVRVGVLVDAVHALALGHATTLRETLSTVRFQSGALWSKGIDGDPDMAPGPIDDCD
jgi:hypothetical protein